MLDKGRVVEWHRVQAYQDVSLKLILQELLQEAALERSNDRVYLRREVDREPLRAMPVLPKEDFHLFVSHHNVGASTFMKLLNMYYTSRTMQNVHQSRRSRHSRHSHSLKSFKSRSFRGQRTAIVPIKVTSDPKQMTHALHFLCYLNADTHASGLATAKFHAELERALRAGMHILLVHETRLEANGTTFKKIIDSTPEKLKWDAELAQKRLYKELAVMICGSVCKEANDHLNVGLHLLSNAITYVPKNEVTHIDTDIEEVNAELSLSVLLEGVDEDDSASPIPDLHPDLQDSGCSPQGAMSGTRRMSQLPRGSTPFTEAATSRRMTLRLDHRRASSQCCGKEGPGRMRYSQGSSTRGSQSWLDEEVSEQPGSCASPPPLGMQRRRSQLPPGARRPSKLPNAIPEQSLGAGSVLLQTPSRESESAGKRASMPGKLTRQGTGRRLTLKLDHQSSSSQECSKDGPGRKRCCIGMKFFPSSSRAQKSTSREDPDDLTERSRRSSCREEALQRKMSTAVSRPERVLRTCARIPGVKLCADAGLQAGRAVQSGVGTVRDTVNAAPGVRTLKSVVERARAAAIATQSAEEAAGSARNQPKPSAGWKSARLRDAIRDGDIAKTVVRGVDSIRTGVDGLRDAVTGGNNAATAALTQEFEALKAADELKVEGLEATIKELQAQLARERALERPSTKGQVGNEKPTSSSGDTGSAAARVNTSTPVVLSTQDAPARNTRRKASTLLSISEEPRKRSVALHTPITLPRPSIASIPTLDSPSTSPASRRVSISPQATSEMATEASRGRRPSRASPHLPNVAPLPQPSRKQSMSAGSLNAATTTTLPDVLPLPQPSRKQSVAVGSFNSPGAAAVVQQKQSISPGDSTAIAGTSTRTMTRPQTQKLDATKEITRPHTRTLGKPQQHDASVHARVQHV